MGLNLPPPITLGSVKILIFTPVTCNTLWSLILMQTEFLIMDMIEFSYLFTICIKCKEKFRSGSFIT